MIHIGSPEYYEAVRAQAGRCDVVVMEGAGGKSFRVRLLTSTYRIGRFMRRSGLVVQNLRPNSFDVPVIVPDMTRGEFAHGWHGIPLRERMLIWLVLPVVVVAMLVRGPRRTVTRRSIEDELTLADLDSIAAAPKFHQLIVDQRDAMLVNALANLHEQRSDEPITVAVLWGAAHVGTVVHAMSSLYWYVPRDGRYLTVLRD